MPNQSPATITVHVPIKFEIRGGRKAIISPTVLKPEQPRFDNALIKALARAFRWRAMIESGEYASITELAAVEKINESYACRILRLTLLAPEIVKSILDGTQPSDITVAKLLRPLPVEWSSQLKMLGLVKSD
jgi:hypothetical protein